MKRIALVLCAGVALVVGVSTAMAGGNSDIAKACQKGGWQTLARTEDNTSGFNNQDECVSYGARGGKLVALAAKAPSITAVSAPVFILDAGTCSVTVPYTPGIDTFLYGVNGHPQSEAITHDVTVTGGVDGADGTAPQFWIGYQAQPGYVIANPGASPTHVDFYNGDSVRDC